MTDEEKAEVDQQKFEDQVRYKFYVEKIMDIYADAPRWKSELMQRENG